MTQIRADIVARAILEPAVEASRCMLDSFSPPYGRLLQASEGGCVAGIAGLRRSRENVGEVKRMYVRPAFRHKGLGRALLHEIEAQAREIGYTGLRLDSTRFMGAAHRLYCSAGFCEIAPYAESEIPAELQQHWIFMEKQLQDSLGWPGELTATACRSPDRGDPEHRSDNVQFTRLRGMALEVALRESLHDKHNPQPRLAPTRKSWYAPVP